MKTPKNQDKKLTITQEQDGFVMIPYTIAKNNKLSDSAIRLYTYLKSHTQNFNLSYQSIANYLHKSESTIKRTIDELKDNGFLVLKRKENKNTYHYELVNSPKLEQINDFSKENILNAFYNNILDIKDILSLLQRKYIDKKTYNEIIDDICKIAKTKWLDDEE